MIEKKYTRTGSKAVGILLPFSTSYLCEKAFSTRTRIKIKHRGELENNLRVGLPTAVLARFATLS
ncbi:LOW QUALITY PROTEIN: hypothetical protein HZS_95 [Henneguya salminicola]|nr:LOW QUALITY PROTEIN: hypothetical protein HZS_95 [Henneguya salminicola]